MAGVCEGPGLKKEVTGYGGAELQMEPEEEDEGGGGVIYIATKTYQCVFLGVRSIGSPNCRDQEKRRSSPPHA
jgi:hypothetical protein